MKRAGKIGAVVLLVVAAAAGAWYWQRSAQQPRWNLLLVTFDTTRADHIGCYGHAGAKTPAFDGLAARGVLFERAYATAPMTMPSHSTMFTGLQPIEHGMVTNGKGRLADDIDTLAEILQQQGYQTAAFVAAFVLDSKFGLDQGFETYNDDLSGTPRPTDVLHRERAGDVVVDAALAWLQQHGDARFHCWIHLYDPHLPYQAHSETGIPDASYDGEISFADRQLGRVLEFLHQQQLDDHTLIVVVGDHGEGLEEHREHGHGYQLYQSTLHVPLVMVRPGEGPRGLRVAEPVSLVDLFPTVLQLLSLSPTKPISGNSLAGLWRRETLESRACFAMTQEPLLDNGWAPLQSLTTADWKYIRTPIAELYDLRADPDETRNLAQEQPERLAELETQLADLESGLHPRQAADAVLTEAEKRALASLGYTGGINGLTVADLAHLPDVKEKLPLYNQLSEAVHLLEEGNPQAAEPKLREVVAADPKFAKALGNLGICLVQLGRRAEAGEMFEKVLKINAKDVSALMNLASSAAAEGRIQEAIDRYGAAIEADRDSPVPLYRLGLLCLDIGELQRAEALFGEALRIDPTYDAVICAEGDLAMRHQDGNRARGRYEAALKVNPRSLHALVNLGILETQEAKWETAESFFQRAVDIDPRNPMPRANLARVAARRGAPQEAVDAFEVLLADSVNYLPAITALGWMRAAHPDPTIRNAEKALVLAERAAEVAGPDAVEALDLRAAALAEAGRFDEARAASDEAIRLARGIPGYPINPLISRRALYSADQPYRSTEYGGSGVAN